VIAACVWLLAAPTWAATFTVDSTGDDPDATPGDGTCATAGSACTLRAAIEEANANADADTIAFDIAGSGVRTITPAGGLPTITAPLTIDGYTQLGSQPNTNPTGAIDAVPLIEIDGSAGSIDCVVVSNASHPGTVTIRGLVINRCSSSLIAKQVTKTPRSRKATRTIAMAAREALLAAAGGLQTDLATLRGALRCPDDAPRASASGR